MKPDTQRQLTTRCLEQGWLDVEDVSDLLWAIDGRFNIQISKLAAALDIPTRPIYPRPKHTSESCLGFNSMSSADVASLLINLERLGLGLDPSFLVTPLAQKIKKAKVLNDSELSVFWYKKQHRKMTPPVLVVDPKSIGSMETEIKTNDGFVVELWRDKGETATMIQSFAPKYKPDRLVA